jgi:hypothetical protein
LRSASSLLRQPETERSRLKLNATTSAQWTYSSVSKASLQKSGSFPRFGWRLSGIFWPKSANAGLRRLSRIRKARIWWAFLVKKRKFSKNRNGWLATQCRSHQSPHKFPANREFYREFCIFAALRLFFASRSPCAAGKFPANREFYRETGDSGGSETALLPKNAAIQRLPGQFPTLTNREMILS